MVSGVGGTQCGKFLMEDVTMWYDDRLRWLASGILAMVILAMGAAALAEVTADPLTILFKSSKDCFVIKLTTNGKPVPAGDIRGWRFVAADHDYKHMIRCTKKDGILEVSASPTMEVGTYDFLIDTKAGAAKVNATVSFADEKDIIQQESEKNRQSVEQAKIALGVAKEGQRGTVAIELPKEYFVGQTLTLTVPAIENHSYMWSMNGNVIESGIGKNSVTYTFKKEGDYTLQFSEKAGDATVAKAEAKTRVVSAPK